LLSRKRIIHCWPRDAGVREDLEKDGGKGEEGGGERGGLEREDGRKEGREKGEMRGLVNLPSNSLWLAIIVVASASRLLFCLCSVSSEGPSLRKAESSSAFASYGERKEMRTKVRLPP